MPDVADARLVFTWLLSFLVLLPAHAQRPRSSKASPNQLWSQYQQSPGTDAGKKAGREALRHWGTAPPPTRLKAIAENLSPEASLWPTLVQSLRTAYRTTSDPLAYRDGYEPLLQILKERVTEGRGWLHVMIALGDYQWAVEQDRWAALHTYEEAWSCDCNAEPGSLARLKKALKKRLRSVRRLDVGQNAPSFQVTTIADSTIDVNQLHGDPAILYFWARWCLPCIRKFPTFNDLQQTYRDTDLHLLGLIFDVPNRDKLHSYLEEVTLTWPQATTDPWAKDTRAPQQLYGVSGPGGNGAGYTVLIDRNGRIAADGYGPKAIRDTLRSMMAQ